MAERPRYKRVLLKLSGESFCPPGGMGLDADVVEGIADQLVPVLRMGVQIGLVVGGGNFIRGRDLPATSAAASGGQPGIRRATADYMGMLATVMNALALQDVLEARGADTRVLSAINIETVCEPLIPRRAVRHLEKGRCVIFAAGTGNPYVTTDTCAAMRARQIDAEILLKATKVDGVFDSDPVENTKARKYEQLAYEKVMADKLGVMDLTAISLCMEHAIPILVFQLSKPGNLMDAICGKHVGTRVSN